MAHIWDYFSFCFVFLNLIGSGGRDVITAFTGRLSCMEVNTDFEGYFLTTLISMYSSYPLCFFLGHQRLMPHGFCFVFYVLFFKIFPDGFFMPGQFTKKKGVILSSISALRLLLHVHV